MANFNIKKLTLPDPAKYPSPTSRKLIDAISKADNVNLTAQPTHGVPGMSTAKTRHLLNQLCGDSKTRYLEIGTWKGSTLIAALYQNFPEYHVAIDSFEECGPTNEVENALNSNCMTVLGYMPNFIKRSSFSFDPLELGIRDINVYFYDGNHSQESTRKAITHYYKSLASEFVLLVDDWNRAEVATGVLEGLAEVDVKLDFVKILPANGDGDVDNWWSGVFAASCVKRI